MSSYSAYGVYTPHISSYSAYGVLRVYAPQAEWRAAFWPGLAMGVMLNAATILQLAAEEVFLLPYAIVSSFARLNLVVAGLWGIFVYQEVTGASLACAAN